MWEWTSTLRGDDGDYAVKGGSWKSPRTDCRTEYRLEGRNGETGYDDVGFRVVKVLYGREPETEVNLVVLEAPQVRASLQSDGSVLLEWNEIEGAVEYQIFGYSEESGLVEMLGRTKDTSYVAEEGNDMSYIVQPVSYTSVCDNVYPEYAVKA